MRDGGLTPATVAKRYPSLQQLFKGLTEDGEIVRSPMERMSPPSVPEQSVPIVSDRDLAALLATCRGNTFENRRDTAIIRLLMDTGTAETGGDMSRFPSAGHLAAGRTSARDL